MILVDELLAVMLPIADRGHYSILNHSGLFNMRHLVKMDRDCQRDLH